MLSRLRVWRLCITADDITTCDISIHGFNEEDYVRMFVTRLEVGRRGKSAETYVPRDTIFFYPVYNTQGKGLYSLFQYLVVRVVGQLWWRQIKVRRSGRRRDCGMLVRRRILVHPRVQ